MIKKIWICLLAFILASCSITPNNPSLIEGSAEGKNGPIKVELFIKDNTIKHIELIEHQETVGFDKTMISIISQVLSSQSLDVDVVSGATESSIGVLNAIKDALDKTDITLSNRLPQKSNQVHSEVLIIGAGSAGITSAIEAVNQGYTDVRVIEKMPFGGGNTRMSGGEYACPNNYLQMQQGINDSKELFFNDIYEGGGKIGKKELIQTIVDHIDTNLEWLMNYIHVEYKDTLSWYGGHTVARTLWPVGDGAAYIDKLINKALDLGVKIDYNTHADRFITDNNNKVIGVKTTYNNETINYYATDGVILATGGFGANVEMRQKYDTTWLSLDENIPTTNSPAATGDGLIMAMDIGANLVGMEYIQLYPINNPATGNYYYMDYARIISNAILVNQDGERFVDEKETRDNIAKAIIAQPSHVAYEFISEKVIDELKLNQDYKDELLRGIDQKVIVIGSLEECAAHFNIPVSTLRKTIENYDAMARNNKDTEFGRTQKLEEIGDGPYVMFSSIVSVHYTMGGVEINEKAQVLNMAGNQIENLYAAGEVTGGVHGNNRLGTLSIPDTVTFGRIAAQTCWKENH